MTNVLTFACERIDGGAASWTPCIDGVRLTELVAAFEVEQGYDDPAGGYGGIIPAYMRLGPTGSYFLGQEEPVVNDEPGEIYTLFCDCGEAGCWPLLAHVTSTEDEVTWDRFSQPHRPNRDYARFGPFKFRRAAYDAAVREAIAFAGDEADA